MSGDWDEPRQKKGQPEHRVGEDLSRLSKEDLHERLELLEGEIQRLKAELAQKETSLSAAEDIFTGRGGN